MVVYAVWDRAARVRFPAPRQKRGLSDTFHMKLFVGAKGLVVYEGKLLFLRESGRYVEGTEKGRWDFPGGRIEVGEPVLSGLAREIREESGLEMRPEGILGVFDGFPAIGGERSHVVRVYFLCAADSAAVTLSEDHDAFAWVLPQDIDAYDLVGDLREVVAAYRAGAYAPLSGVSAP